MVDVNTQQGIAIRFGVTFDTPFTSMAQVTLLLATTAPQNVSAGVISCNKTGFSGHIHRSDATPLTAIRWIAVGE